jgi:Arc/MetJ-type ribon-helix-helix transcriptional regulator
MPKTIGGKRPGAGRPPTGRDPSRTFRLSDEFIANVDAWAASQGDAPTRSDAIRRLVELGLKAKK